MSLKLRINVGGGGRKFFLGAMLCVWGGTAFAGVTPGFVSAGNDVLVEHGPLIQAVSAVMGIILAACFILRKVTWQAGSFLSGNTQVSGLAPSAPREELAEEKDLEGFKEEFRAGPLPATTLSLMGSSVAPGPIPGSAGKDNAENGGSPLDQFLAWASEETAALQRLVDRAAAESSLTVQQELLVKAHEQAGQFKLRAGLPELRPARQVATALEGLLKQLISRADNINPSTLRTTAMATQLLADLCRRGLPEDLATDPAIRILAVDDDPVSRFALKAALKKAFDEPELAENGETALAAAGKQAYDLIILDVMMPGMDGFEVCTKIRENSANHDTPVLFVTALRGFDARAKSMAAGGRDLLGKPFLAFEITLKALTMVLRARLARHDKPMTAGAAADPGASAVRWPELASKAATDEHPALPEKPASTEGGKTRADDIANKLTPPPVFGESAAKAAGSRELSPAFVEFVAASVGEMKNQITAIGNTEDANSRWEMISRLHLRLQLLSGKMDVPELKPAHDLCSALEGLYKKFKESPKNATLSALRSSVTGLELLKDLCAPGIKPDLADNPPMRILVVDDEPLARRAITGALQMAFSRPTGADCGETALALAEQQEFDLVFLDVCMPGLDGFAVCSKLHETEKNRATPVVFVTSHSDEEFRAESVRRGGRDFVVKPVVFLEITVKALTFALRGRLEKLKLTPAGETTAAGNATVAT